MTKRAVRKSVLAQRKKTKTTTLSTQSSQTFSLLEIINLLALSCVWLLIKLGFSCQKIALLIWHTGILGLEFAQKLILFIIQFIIKLSKALTGTKLKLTLLAVILFIALAFIVKFIKSLPSPYNLLSSNLPLTTQIYDRKGQLLYQIYGSENRQLVSLKDLPAFLPEATVAIEDKHFYSHPGIDPWEILRALRIDLTSSELQGGSTITQQLIKNTLLNNDQTLTRKVKEIILALWAERIFSKQQILQMYLNEVPYGGTAWGIESASAMYFGKHAKDLDLAQSAYLAGLPAAPTQYSPYSADPKKGKERQQEVFQRMVEDGYISNRQASEAYNEKLEFSPPDTSIKAPHFVMYVKNLLVQRFGEKRVSQGGLNVTTTLDSNIQNLAQKAVTQEVGKLAYLNVGNGAAMVTDTRTGQILAMVGSKDYWDPDGGNYNVTLALRQPGSSIKIITYATAFKQGFSPGTIILDLPTTFSNPWGVSYSPVNYDGRFHGPIPIRVAFASSFNIPAVKVLSMEGIPNFLQTAKDLGITTFNQPQNYGLSLTLGGAAVKMIDMMSAYGTAANQGVRHKPVAILKVADSYGHVLEDDSKDPGQPEISPQVAFLIANILSDNNARTPAFGPNSLLEIPGYSVAVKTGTSDDKRDNWAFGFTPKYVVGAWVGNNDYSPMNQELASGITGATPIWHDIMSSLLAGSPKLTFTRPAGIIETNIDGHQDLAIDGKSPKEATRFEQITQTDPLTGQEKQVVTYSDPFTNFTPSITKQ